MIYEEGHFYRDADGDVWQAVSRSILMFAAHADGDLEVTAFDVVPGTSVELMTGGPLVEVRPTGWEAV